MAYFCELYIISDFFFIFKAHQITLQSCRGSGGLFIQCTKRAGKKADKEVEEKEKVGEDASEEVEEVGKEADEEFKQDESILKESEEQSKALDPLKSN